VSQACEWVRWEMCALALSQEFPEDPEWGKEEPSSVSLVQIPIQTA
jgi:hypothetical protein